MKRDSPAADIDELLRERGGPRSRLVDAMFVLLLARPMKASELAGVLNKEPKYVSSYLSYWRSRGYVDYDMGLWYLTPKGEDYARHVAESQSDQNFNEFVALAQRLLSSSISQTRNDKRRVPQEDKASGSQSLIANLTSSANKRSQESRASIAACALQSLKDVLSDEESEVVMTLLSHFTKYGTTYMYLDQLAERLKADYEWLLRRARDLQSKGIVYIYTDPRLGIRVGFSKKVKEVIRSCQQ